MLYNTSQVQQVQLSILHFHCQALPERAYVCIIKSLWKPSSTFVDFTGSILQGFTSAYSARICLHCYMCKVSIKSLWTPRSSPGLDLCVWEKNTAFYRPVARGWAKICGPLACRWSVLPLTAAPGNTDQGGRLASSPGAFAPSHSRPSQKSADGVPEWIARVATNNRWFRALRRQSGWRTCCQTIQHYAPAPTAKMSAQSGSWQ